jgi:hypothetical protein
MRNDTIFANLIWELSQYFRVAEEFTYRKTAYTVVPNKQAKRFLAYALDVPSHFPGVTIDEVLDQQGNAVSSLPERR